MALCPVNTAGEVRFPNSCLPYIFLRVLLLHVDANWHGAKLVYHDGAGLEFKILKTTKVQSSESNISIDKFYNLSFQQRCI